MIIDTHCHYNLEPLWGEGKTWQQHWQRAHEEKVAGAVVVGTDYNTSQIAVDIASHSPNLRAAVGIHPTDIDNTSSAPDPNLLNKLTELAKNDSVVAIGEIGIDYFRTNQADLKAARIAQQNWCSALLDIANQVEKPVILHVRDKQENAHQDIMFLLQKHNPKHGIVFHCFTGPDWYWEQALTMDAYLGVAGNITYPNSGHLQSQIQRTPTNKILVETDAPFLPPQPYRGQTCLPSMINTTHNWLISNTKATATNLISNTQNCFKYNFGEN